jgi:ribose transport system substrate-binding protein
MRITNLFQTRNPSIIGLLLAGVLTTQTFADHKKLSSWALTVGDLGNPFFVQIARSAEAQAKHINDKVKFTALSSNYDVNNQTNQIDNFISSNVNLILLGAADSKGIAPAVIRAKQSGITVIAVDVGAEGGRGRHGHLEQQTSRYQRWCIPSRAA